MATVTMTTAHCCMTSDTLLAVMLDHSQCGYLFYSDVAIKYKGWLLAPIF